MKIIINADDFGKSQSVNNAICDCFKKGYVTSTTLMVNMPFADEAVNLAKKEGFWDRVGLHLNLIEGNPLNKSLLKYPCVCDEKRNFNGKFHKNLKTRFFLSKEIQREIAIEIELQIKRFLTFNPSYLHMDSHQHVHIDWSIIRILKPLFINYGFSTLRLSKNVHVETGLFKKMYKRFFNTFIRGIATTTDYFCGFPDFYDFMKNNEIVKNKVVELMCHPDYISGELKNLYSKDERTECFESFSEVIKAQKQISFREL